VARPLIKRWVAVEVQHLRARSSDARRTGSTRGLTARGQHDSDRDERDKDPNEAPETPPDEPRPPRVQDPPPQPDPPGPYVVHAV
jgi:hypothetical protein